MRVEIEYKQYDRMIYLSGWRYSATVTGMIQYFDYCGIEYEIGDHSDYGSCLFYRDADVSDKEKYLLFVESYYEDLMCHRQVEKKLTKDNPDKKFISSINKLLKEYRYSEILFSGLNVWYDGTNKDKILNIINEYRYELIRNRYANALLMYRRFADYNKLFLDDQKCCRLHGYWVDQDRKTKSLGYCFDNKSYTLQDIKEFDFIPFAFENGFFINNNYNIQAMVSVTRQIKSFVKNGFSEHTAIFKQVREMSKYAVSDVEIIYAPFDSKRFESLYLRNKSVFVINKIKIECMDIAYAVFNQIINLESLDTLIESCLKKGRRKETIEKLIDINICIEETRKEYSMNDVTIPEKNIDRKRYLAFQAKNCAVNIVKKLNYENRLNKVDTYRNKLINALYGRDCDRVCQILLQFASYTSTPMPFATELFYNFEDNKYLIHIFIAELDKNNIYAKKENNANE